MISFRHQEKQRNYAPKILVNEFLLIIIQDPIHKNQPQNPFHTVQ